MHILTLEAFKYSIIEISLLTQGLRVSCLCESTRVSINCHIPSQFVKRLKCSSQPYVTVKQQQQAADHLLISDQSSDSLPVQRSRVCNTTTEQQRHPVFHITLLRLLKIKGPFNVQMFQFFFLKMSC